MYREEFTSAANRSIIIPMDGMTACEIIIIKYLLRYRRWNGCPQNHRNKFGS